MLENEFTFVCRRLQHHMVVGLTFVYKTQMILLLLVQRHHSVTSTQQTRVSLLYGTQNYDVTHSVCDSNVNKSSIEETATNASAILTSFSHTYRDYVDDVIELAFIIQMS